MANALKRIRRASIPKKRILRGPIPSQTNPMPLTLHDLEHPHSPEHSLQIHSVEELSSALEA